MLNRLIVTAVHLAVDPIRLRLILFVGIVALAALSLLATGTLAFADGGGGGTHWCTTPGC